MQVTINPDNPRTSPRQRKELINNLIYGKETPVRESQWKSKDMIPNFSVDEWSW